MPKKSPTPKEPSIFQQFLSIWNRCHSDLCETRSSGIHGQGVYATQDIKKGTRIIEYVGEIIDKAESERRGIAQQQHADQFGTAAVYIFTLDDHFDLDGNFPWNIARLINHSCSPNCEAEQEGDQIFIHAICDIQANQELTFDYGFDIEHYAEHPCRCGSPNCIGYIVAQSQWPDLHKRLSAPPTP